MHTLRWLLEGATHTFERMPCELKRRDKDPNRKLISMEPGLLKNRRDWLAAAAKQTITFHLQNLYHVNACVHMHMRVELLLIIVSLKKSRDTEKVAKTLASI